MKTPFRAMKMSLAAVLSVSMLGACSQSGGSEEPTSEEKVELVFQHIGGTVPAQVGLLDEMAKEFNKQNPDVTVKIVNVGWGEAYSMFQRQVAVGQAPDLVMLNGQWASEYQRLGAFAPVNDYVSQEMLDLFLESGFDSVKGEDGKYYGVPWDGSVWGFFYRTDLFEEAGLDPDSPPQTWEELLDYAQKLTKDKQYGLAFPAAGWEPDDYVLPFFWQAGNDVVVKEGNFWRPTIDNESGLAVAKYIYDLANTYQVMPKTVTGMDWEATMNSFISGNTAMMYNGMWATGSLKANPELDGKWATAPSPVGPAGEAVLGYPNTLSITEQSKHKEIAGKFLEFIFTGEKPTYYDKFAEVTSVVGWTKDFATTDFAQDPIMKPFVDQVSISRNRPLAPKYEEFRQLHFNAAIQKLIQGQLTPEQFVKDMHTKLEELMGQ
ncbi:sugar ABC transporter substrate-binding protein [Paenibacillus sp. J2TS4]|uniref:ABC transporter substrate-binding protein n=1 Tax=Paenibacillus sp. J2TS4 TaxID=2807194 RepID=UPI001AFFD4BF|nr:sugar ABC transporter substrate-binding protein [Paenibacillus sp. J2TS4]GIP31726.1 sugar ABC transporter substrate-binding protein [Paenibacillus sp. J2TS4]